METQIALRKSQQSFLEKILNKARPYQSTRPALLKWELFIELQNVSALKSIIQISDEQNQHLTNEKNQLITQLWNTRKIHSSVQMELSKQLTENRSLF